MVDTLGFGGIDVGNVGRGFCLTPGQQASGSNGMIEAHLQQHLEPVAQRHRELRFSVELALGWLAVAFLAFVFLLLRHYGVWSHSSTFAVLVFLAAVASGIAGFRFPRSQPDFRQIARKIEAENPELHALLL